MVRQNMSQRRGILASFIALVMAAATVAVATPAQAANNCGAQFTDSGAPDDASCTFGCTAGQRLTIGVDASDDDATASGSARCGGGYSPCRTSAGASSCYGEEGVAASSSSNGQCAAVVNELWNSAWSYSCAAVNVDECTPTCGGGPGDPPKCIFDVLCCPSAVCEGGSDDPPDLGNLPTPSDLGGPCIHDYGVVAPDPARVLDKVDACNTTGQAAGSDPVTGLPRGVTSRIDVRVSPAGVVTGRLCNAGVGCWSILPVCVVDQALGRAECTVPAAPKVLGPAAPYGT